MTSPQSRIMQNTQSKDVCFMRYIFIYLPALIFYLFSFYVFLIHQGFVSNPTAFNPSDYEPVASKTVTTDDTVTDIVYYAPKN